MRNNISKGKKKITSFFLIAYPEIVIKNQLPKRVPKEK